MMEVRFMMPLMIRKSHFTSKDKPKHEINLIYPWLRLSKPLKNYAIAALFYREIFAAKNSGVYTKNCAAASILLLLAAKWYQAFHACKRWTSL